MSCEDCLSRRKFLANAATAGVVGLVVLTGCGDGELSGVATKMPTGGGPGGGGGGGGPVTIKVGDFPGLATVGVLVAVNGFTAVVRTGSTMFDALSMTCTHQGCPIDIVNNGAKFHCFCHGSEFSTTGAVVQGPADQPLHKFTTSYDSASDQLTIS